MNQCQGFASTRVWDNGFIGSCVCVCVLPLRGWNVSGALGAVPSAVGVSSQAAFCTALPINMAPVQGHLHQPVASSNKQLLLHTQTHTHTYAQSTKPGAMTKKCLLGQAL